MSQTPVLAFTAGAIGLAGLYAAYKGVSWLSTIESALDPKHYSQIGLPGNENVVYDSQTPEASEAPSAIPGVDLHGQVVQFAKEQLGKPYLYGGSGPNRWDCSGLTQAAFASVGYTMPHNAEAQWVQTRKYRLPKNTDPPPGTLIFYGAGGFADHCGISVGGGEMIEAPHTGDVVKYYSIAQEVTYFGWYSVTDPLSSLKVVKRSARSGKVNVGGGNGTHNDGLGQLLNGGV